MEREFARLWPRVWLLGAHQGDVARAGDYVTVDIANEPILLVRGHDNQIRGFFNVCPHRGNRLCANRRGRAATLRCSYHHWEMALDGSIARISDPDSFLQAQSAPGLSQIRCTEAAGFIWFAMDPDAVSLSDFLGPLLPILESWKLEEWSRVVDVSVDVACNWKLSVDAHNESYHVHSLHPEVLDKVDDTAARVVLHGAHGQIIVPLGVPSQRLGKPRQGEAGGENHLLYAFPNLHFNRQGDQLMLFRHRPHHQDPQRMTFDQQVYQRNPGNIATPSHRRVTADDPVIGKVTGADLRIVEEVQRGTRSRGFRGPFWSQQEACIRNMYETLDQYLES